MKDKRTVPVELDLDTTSALERWKKEEQWKSSRGHAAVVLRRVARVYREKPEELERLGIKERTTR